MSTWYTKGNGGTSKNTVNVNKCCVPNGVEDLTRKTAMRQWMGDANKSISESDIEETYDTDDEDDVNNDSDTSSSFSLQECMREFRSRRMRRASLTQFRQEADKDWTVGSNNDQAISELALINQNFSNKQQERKFKQCKDGFCYCFTSDSADGGGNVEGCNKFENTKARNSRRIGRSKCIKLSNAGKSTKRPLLKEVGKERKGYVPKSPVTKFTYIKSTRNAGSRLKAISSLDANTVDGPLIHIIQELHENCVISKVKVNKRTMQALCCEPKYNKTEPMIQHEISRCVDQVNARENNESDKYIPTAPLLENCYGFENNGTRKTSRKNKMCAVCSYQHSNVGGQLLQKRLSSSQISYHTINNEKAPLKPPRTFLSDEDNTCQSSTSTSSSVRAAEIVVDNFLIMKGIKAEVTDTTNSARNIIKSMEASTYIKEFDNCKSDEQTSSETKTREENISTYPLLSDVKLIESKKIIPYHKNINTGTHDITKLMRLDCNESTIKDMLNYDANMSQGEFHSMSSQAQPQENYCIDISRNENPIGWQISSKINLDTVDGIVHHNLASNFGHKNTPVKTKMNSPSQKSDYDLRKEKFLWSEQLRNLSPWSKKCNNNFRSSSKAFIISSKNKFLRLVSPKKGNDDDKTVQVKKTSCQNVGIQTSPTDFACTQSDMRTRQFQPYSSTLQSPPGSYHSPMQSSHIEYLDLVQFQNSTPSKTDPGLFDFSRTVHSPPKKSSRSSNRKLNFPLNCTFTSNKESGRIDIFNSTGNCNHEKTYRSFNKEVDHDASISQISSILSNIRAKLECSDQNAVHTFRETKSTAIDCTNIHNKTQIDERIDTHKCSKSSNMKENDFIDAIYSEIEDAFFSPQSTEFDNHNDGIQHFAVDGNPDIFYARVNKGNKSYGVEPEFRMLKSQIPLARIMRDSLKSNKVTTNLIPLPTLSEPPESESNSYYLPLSSKSLNNIRVMEHNSYPRKQSNLSKSDLTLHRSEIFFENLCKSELLIDVESKCREKLQNHKKSIPCLDKSLTVMGSMCQLSTKDDFSISQNTQHNIARNDSVSYELANDEVDIGNHATAESDLASNKIVAPSLNNQNTPKKRSFVTKHKPKKFVPDTKAKKISDQLYNSCPHSLCKHNIMHMADQQNESRCVSMDEVSRYESVKKSKLKTLNALERYKSLKHVFHNSFRKSKIFIRNQGKRLSNSLNMSMSYATEGSDKQQCTYSAINLEDLSLNGSSTIREQLAKAVSICRELPHFESSMEMVEAERLLLFSRLREKNQLNFPSTEIKNDVSSQKPLLRFFVDDMFLPVISDISHDKFFNYFYIVTFEYGGIIKSTQSSECINGMVMFRDNGIEFLSYSEIECDILKQQSQNAVKCNIFMLRLRKIYTNSMEPKQNAIIETLTQAPAAIIKSTSSSSNSSSSFDEVVSRFRLHASFTLNAYDFVPYEYVQQESYNSNTICIRSSCNCTLPLTIKTKSTNLSEQLVLKGRAEMRIRKCVYDGFLNVQDPNKQHFWNRRWCTLDGIFLQVWEDKNSLSASPLISVDLRDSKNYINHPLTCSSRELCARPRSFSLICKTDKPCKVTFRSSIYFAAETQENVDDWLKNLNHVLNFITTWL